MDSDYINEIAEEYRKNLNRAADEFEDYESIEEINADFDKEEEDVS